MAPLVVLASASPRRTRILESLGIAHRVAVSGVPEDLRPGEAPAAAVERLARAKAEAVAVREDGPTVIAADTVVVAEGVILGKPASDEDAVRMLRRLSGRTHEVVTGVCVRHGAVARSGIERTAVTFASLSDAEIDWYVRTGEPADKAGAYHVDGRGALFITRIDGSPSNVAGLPIALLRRLAAEAGAPLGLPESMRAAGTSGGSAR